MAGDWIKMRSNLWDDPRIARLCDLTNQGEATIIGGLYWLWMSADQHTETGLMPGLSIRQINRKAGIDGFGEALVAIGWISESEDAIHITNFEEHNGQSAKRRATDAKRKARSRSSSAVCPNDVRDMSATEADKTRTPIGRSVELEKEKEKEKENTPCSPPLGDHATPEQIDQIFTRAYSDSFAGAFAMTFDWEPGRSLDARLAQMGINLAVHPTLYADALAAFRNHHEATSKVKRQAQWESALASWIQRDIRKLESSQGSTARASNGEWSPPPLADFPEED
ncbi:Primosomal protein I [Marinobacterium lacunae]|uniref:Primosomal protein I n=1 Tax=Marinobacterium lacunae TaxID=1232683 RepID=A0A081FX69_9GAMM|nr:DnaT-like ssDNA-binding domain-containing protein [Marinobacterium lacunae]KEA63124.1 Primosomal protein I [Marinobacterium lacunae]